ncbi:unnamed protein product [Didymodactylos carnosus]|uniref:Uncharacterized protein n=1 Tax=Didymodactylos carnosus TaxID=1234261 RepID=A0A814DVI5_9BILA|nr:unnamed protein product [Didymodactylos carnosus]CAF0959628.1 unnamed protein product [Didymodactylos carnosus]CAF3558716.1 unnamed protein product [Didymodactylos carnosus]CAF3734351.1 unnamed protein product [Didymodactylos carnosus]
MLHTHLLNEAQSSGILHRNIDDEDDLPTPVDDMDGTFVDQKDDTIDLVDSDVIPLIEKLTDGVVSNAIVVAPCDNYTPLSIQEYYMDFSTTLSSTSGQVSDAETLAAGSKFCLQFTLSARIAAQSTNCGSVGKRRRKKCSKGSRCWGGVTWPTATLASAVTMPTKLTTTISSCAIVQVPVNVMTAINISVLDAINDYLRCRWAKKSPKDECGDVCHMVSGGTLDRDNCILSFNSIGKTVGQNYAVALMVEDYWNETTDVSFSSASI